TRCATAKILLSCLASRWFHWLHHRPIYKRLPRRHRTVLYLKLSRPREKAKGVPLHSPFLSSSGPCGTTRPVDNGSDIEASTPPSAKEMEPLAPICSFRAVSINALP